MATAALLFGLIVLASGVFVLVVAGVALVDALERVRVRRASVADVFVGHALLRGYVAATHGSMPAPFSELPCVFARTTVVVVDDQHRFSHSPANVRGSFVVSTGFGIEDDTGTLDIAGRDRIGALDTIESASLDRLPEHLEGELHRRYGDLATLPPAGGKYRVLESTLLVGEEICATTYNYRWEREIRRVIVSVGKRPVIPEVHADFRDARALALVAAILLALGASFVGM